MPRILPMDEPAVNHPDVTVAFFGGGLDGTVAPATILTDGYCTVFPARGGQYHYDFALTEAFGGLVWLWSGLQLAQVPAPAPWKGGAA